MLEKVYRVIVSKYDYFGGDKSFTKCFSSPKEAMSFYKNERVHDFDYEDAHQHTWKPYAFFRFVKEPNKHSFCTPEENRLISVPIYGWDGGLIEKVTTTLKELRESDLALSFNNWVVDFENLCIRDAGLSLIDFIRNGEISFN